MIEISTEDAIRFQQAAKQEAVSQMTAVEMLSPEGQFVLGCFDVAIAALADAAPQVQPHRATGGVSPEEPPALMGGDWECLEKKPNHKCVPSLVAHKAASRLRWLEAEAERLRRDLKLLLEAATEYQTATENLRVVGGAASESLHIEANAELLSVMEEIRSSRRL